MALKIFPNEWTKVSFWPILTPWWGNQILPEKKPSTKCYLHWYVTSCKKLEKINEWFLTYSQENGKKGHFGPWWGNQIFPTKKPWTKFYAHRYVISCKKSEKINAWFSRYSVTNGRTELITYVNPPYRSVDQKSFSRPPFVFKLEICILH